MPWRQAMFYYIEKIHFFLQNESKTPNMPEERYKEKKRKNKNFCEAVSKKKEEEEEEEKKEKRKEKEKKSYCSFFVKFI